MPLHDWSLLPEWDGVHQLWITALFYEIKSKLPAGYRAGLATVPGLTIGGPVTHPDVNVHRSPPPPTSPDPDGLETFAYDDIVSALTLNTSMVIHVRRQRDLVAVLELISPRNKDRERTRTTTRDRLLGYLMLGVHVMYIDIHAQPFDFSLADSLANALEIPQPPCPSPHALAYAVGGELDGGGRQLSVRRAPLTIGRPLPPMPLPLQEDKAIILDLEVTYSKACGDYLTWLPATEDT
jgi:hypothetical protein